MYLTYQIAGKVAHVDLRFAELVVIAGWRLSRGYIRHGNGAYLHRLITNALPNQLVDHIDGDPLNNELSNLRICSHAENMRNRKKHANNRSGIKGVYLERNRWRAQITAHGKRHYLGSYESLEEAQAAYDGASIRLHGEFSRINSATGAGATYAI